MSKITDDAQTETICAAAKLRALASAIKWIAEQDLKVGRREPLFGVAYLLEDELAPKLERVSNSLDPVNLAKEPKEVA